jgi:cytochrome c55X
MVPLAAFALTVFAGCAAPRVLAEAIAAEVHAQIDSGKALFATACANCHGAGGKGAIGPPLVDRNLSLDILRTTILNGRVGTPMPPFRDQLDSKSLASVIAYAESLSSGGRLPSETISIQTELGSSPSRPSSLPVSIGKEQGIPARGEALFFDPTRMYSCRVCHSYDDKGGPIGPDLAKSPKTPEQIYNSISRARVAAADYPAIALRLSSGAYLVGIKSAETADAYVIFDLSSLPPVKRAVPKSQVAETVPAVNSGIYDHTALPFTNQDLLDLSAYLGRTAASPAVK